MTQKLCPQCDAVNYSPDLQQIKEGRQPCWMTSCDYEWLFPADTIIFMLIDHIADLEHKVSNISRYRGIH